MLGRVYLDSIVGPLSISKKTWCVEGQNSRDRGCMCSFLTLSCFWINLWLAMEFTEQYVLMKTIIFVFLLQSLSVTDSLISNI